VQNLTGREGSFHARRMRAYGTVWWPGEPGKGNAVVDGVPVFDAVAQAVEATGANARWASCPPVRPRRHPGGGRRRPGAHRLHHRGHPGPGRGAGGQLPAADRRPAADRPQLPGVISPGKASVGIMPHEVCLPGRVGVVSRSAPSPTSDHELTIRGSASPPAWASGGPGARTPSSRAGPLRGRPRDRVVCSSGDRGRGRGAGGRLLRAHGKPVVAYIAGFIAPPGRKMGHAGAIISGSSGTAAPRRRPSRPPASPSSLNPNQIGEAWPAFSSD